MRGYSRRVNESISAADVRDHLFLIFLFSHTHNNNTAKPSPFISVKYYCVLLSITMVAIGQLVKTPYGKGKAIEIRTEHVVVEPTTWELALGQKPTYYMNKADVTPIISPTDKVQTPYGVGFVQSVRDDGVIIVLLENWKLATGVSPVLYLQSDNIAVLQNNSTDKKDV